jgi:glycosyltransferase involved in cell wall biosynthesis
MKISVSMATYNGEKYIYAQLESILKQLSENDEVVISDDSSADKTVDIIKSFNDKRIRLLKHIQARNPIYNFENSLKHARGDIIVLSDQDNIWFENRINIIRKHFYRKERKINTLILDGFIVDENENVLSNSLLEEIRYRKGIMRNILRNTYMGCTMAFPRDLLKVALPFPKNLPMHDIWLGILSEIYGEVDLSEEKTLKFRIHSLNASLKDLANICYLQRIRWRFFLVVNLLCRYLTRRSV